MNSVEMMRGRGEEQKDGTGTRLDNTTETLRILRFGEGESFSSGVWERQQMCELARIHIYMSVSRRHARAVHLILRGCRASMSLILLRTQ